VWPWSANGLANGVTNGLANELAQQQQPAKPPAGRKSSPYHVSRARVAIAPVIMEAPRRRRRIALLAVEDDDPGDLGTKREETVVVEPPPPSAHSDPNGDTQPESQPQSQPHPYLELEPEPEQPDPKPESESQPHPYLELEPEPEPEQEPKVEPVPEPERELGLQMEPEREFWAMPAEREPRIWLEDPNTGVVYRSYLAYVASSPPANHNAPMDGVATALAPRAVALQSAYTELSALRARLETAGADAAAFPHDEGKSAVCRELQVALTSAQARVARDDEGHDAAAVGGRVGGLSAPPNMRAPYPSQPMPSNEPPLEVGEDKPEPEPEPEPESERFTRPVVGTGVTNLTPLQAAQRRLAFALGTTHHHHHHRHKEEEAEESVAHTNLPTCTTLLDALDMDCVERLARRVQGRECALRFTLASPGVVVGRATTAAASAPIVDCRSGAAAAASMIPEDAAPMGTSVSTTSHTKVPQTAICYEHVMLAGRHYVEVEFNSWQETYRGNCGVGVVGPTFPFRACVAHSADKAAAYQHSAGWTFSTMRGNLGHDRTFSQWLGQRKGVRCGDRSGAADRVGLLLNLTAGSLSVYVNGERWGLLVPRGLVPPLWWAVDLVGDVTVSISALPPPDEEPGLEYPNIVRDTGNMSSSVLSPYIVRKVTHSD
jgi:hypothetical protein